MCSRTPFSFSMALVCVLVACHASVAAQTSPRPVLLDAAQQAALGIHVARLQPAQSQMLLANATVTAAPNKEFTITAPYPGHIARQLVGVGDSVKAGAALAYFTSAAAGEARRQLQDANLEAATAKAVWQRDQAMFDEGIIPAARLQLSRAKYEAAKASLTARSAELGASGLQFDANTQVTGYATGALHAPMAGVVTQALASVGQRIEAGTILFKLADASQLYLDIQLSADKAAQLKVGDEVGISSRQAKGEVVGVSRAVDTNQSAKARARISVRGTLQIGELLPVNLYPRVSAATLPNTLWQVPSRAISQWQGMPIVFIVQRNGFVAQPVKVVSSNDDVSLVEIVLPSQSQVAITGIASLRALLQAGE